MRVKKLFAVVLALAMIFSLAGCSGKGHSDSVVGTWNNIDSKDSTGRVVFKDNGTFQFEGLGYKIGGTYEVNEKDCKIKMTYDKSSYRDIDGNEKDLGKPGYYKNFDSKTKKAGGGIANLTSFEGEYIIYEASNKDYLEILLIDPSDEDSTDATIGGKKFKGIKYKWRYERSYEG